MTSQQQADLALAEWQRLRAEYPDPEQRIDALFREMFRPPLSHDTRYDDQLRAVAAEMSTP